MTNSLTWRDWAAALAVACALLFTSACGTQTALFASDPTSTPISASVTASWAPTPCTVYNDTLSVSDGVLQF